MSASLASPTARRYPGEQWLGPDVRLPRTEQSWPPAEGGLQVGRGDELSDPELKAYLADKPWVWTGGDLYFFCDQHADTDALLLSLITSGGVRRTGPADHDFELTPAGRAARFVIGGDCFDKGPSNLRLLRQLQLLIERGADVRLLAGNHDLRTYLGLARLGSRKLLEAHLFARLGGKSATLFQEVYQHYLRGQPQDYLDDAEVRRRVFPDETWYERFPQAAEGLIHPRKLAKELVRIREKVQEIDERCRSMDMSLGMLYAAAEKCRELFLDPAGELAWYFRSMRLSYRCGSYLFIHGGVCDKTANLLARQGCSGLNARFAQLMQADLFELYHGEIGNTFRTKYRDYDLPLTASGVEDMHRAGIYAIVHGHKNILEGQRLVMREGILNFECDASVDANTRIREGLRGRGGAATVFEKNGRVLGLSTDHPFVKVFDPVAHGGTLTVI